MFSVSATLGRRRCSVYAIMTDATRLLLAIGQGDSQAAADLLPLVYEELRRLAAAQLASERPGQTLDATALVHEAYLRLVGNQNPENDIRWDNRGHFYAAAAEAMRRILVEAARRKHRLRHGGDQRRIPLESIDAAADMPDENVLALDEALQALAATAPLKARLVELRFFRRPVGRGRGPLPRDLPGHCRPLVGLRAGLAVRFSPDGRKSQKRVRRAGARRRMRSWAGEDGRRPLTPLGS
jgi:RNA polymerase sigma factor (TIGR02999 family)